MNYKKILLGQMNCQLAKDGNDKINMVTVFKGSSIGASVPTDKAIYNNRKYEVSGALLNKLFINVSDKTISQIELADIKELGNDSK